MTDLTKLIVALCACLVACAPRTDLNSSDSAKLSIIPQTRPNVILMIGDGMGVTQLSSRWYYDESSKPAFTRFSQIGLLRTSSAKERVTDSAAGATAYSIGRKSYNGAIGVDVDTVAHETILEYLETKGYNTGLVVTSSVVHATPASFYAHIDHRNRYEEIADQLVTADVDFFAGGGTKFFANRTDHKNQLLALENAGFQMDTTSLQSNLNPDKRYGFLLAKDGMPKMLEGRGEYLADATDLGIKYLESKNAPFFMLIEGSQIDWGGHANDADYLQSEMLDFDHVIGKVLDYAEKDGNTIVIVTADHECGGFALSAGEKFKRSDYSVISPTFTTGGHSASMVPLMVYGPGASSFTGIYENIDVYHRLMKLLP